MTVYPKANLPIRNFGEDKIARNNAHTKVDLDRELPPLHTEAGFICGLRRKIFWDLTAIISIGIMAVVGANSGATLSHTGGVTANPANITQKKTSSIL